MKIRDYLSYLRDLMLVRFHVSSIKIVLSPSYYAQPKLVFHLYVGGCGIGYVIGDCFVALEGYVLMPLCHTHVSQMSKIPKKHYFGVV